MAVMTGQFPQGNCSPAQKIDGRLVCSPVMEKWHEQNCGENQWFLFFARIDGTAGECVSVTIEWPEYDPSKRDPLKNKYDTASFLPAARECLFMSADKQNWERIENAETEGWQLKFDIVLPAEETYVSVNLYYTPEMYASLSEAVRSCAYIQESTIGQSWGGHDIRMYRATDASVPACEKHIVYLQSAQHASEFGGCHLCDSLLRYLSAGSQDARALLRKYEFHVLPVAAVSGWLQGVQEYPGPKNPNTVWDTIAYPETKAIDAYLKKLPQKPELLLDLHTGWVSYEKCGAGITIIDDLGEEVTREQERFAALLGEEADYLAPDELFGWRSRTNEKLFKSYAQKYYGQGFTLEFSRFNIYDREEGKRTPLSMERYRYCQELCAKSTASLMKLVRRRPNRPRACSAWLPVSRSPVVRQGWRSHLRSP